MSQPRSPAEFWAGMRRKVKELPTKLGHFSQVFSQDGAPPVRGDDLLPIDPKEVATFLHRNSRWGQLHGECLQLPCTFAAGHLLVIIKRV